MSERPRPQHVDFFIEEHSELHPGVSRPAVLQRLLTDEVCDPLHREGWGITIASVDLDHETASVLRNVNREFPNIPITMWVTLPDQDGYWTSNTNVGPTRQRTNQILRWIDEYNLVIAGLGFDLEPPIEFVKRFNAGPGSAARALFERRIELRALERQGYDASDDLRDLLSELRHGGVTTEAYNIWRPLASVFGVPYLGREDVDRPYTMIYTSFIPRALERHALEHGIDRNSHPAFGNVSCRGTDSGRILGGKSQLLGETGLMRAVSHMRRRGEQEGVDYLERVKVFALTGPNVVMWTQRALSQSQGA